jgi:hypothetical protein
VATQPIRAYSWWLRQRLAPIEGAPLLVGELRRWAYVDANLPLLIHDRAWRRSALAAPRAIIAAADRLDLPDDAPVATSGLLELISAGQVTVHEQTPARSVVRMVAARPIVLAIVVDDFGWPQGLFVPGTVNQRLRETIEDRQQYLPPYPPEPGPRAAREAERAALMHLMSNPAAFQQDVPPGDELVQAIDALDQSPEDFHSENLNERNPELGECTDTGFSHYVPLPCAEHSGAAVLGLYTIGLV